ncbi:MAG: hypothetical protein KA981_11645 [Bacteroidia bacterium]|nr:hypothetical protein [Bacteroidia bacterium]
MAYITGEFHHPIYEIELQVLQPTEDENDFERGLNVNVDWESMQDFKTANLRQIAAWILTTCDTIDRKFNADGSLIK